MKVKSWLPVVIVSVVAALAIASGVRSRGPSTAAGPASPIDTITVDTVASVPSPRAETSVVDDRLRHFADRNAENPLAEDFSALPAPRTADEIAVVRAVASDPHEHDAIRNEAFDLLRRAGDPGLIALLAAIIASPDETPRARAFAAQHVGMAFTATAADDARTMLRGALRDGEPAVRREALLALSRGRDADAVALVAEGPDGPRAAGMRDLVIRCMRELDQRERIATVRAALTDTDADVRIAALATLSAWRDEPSRAAFAAAASDADARLARAGQRALQALDGLDPDQAIRAPSARPPQTTIEVVR